MIALTAAGLMLPPVQAPLREAVPAGLLTLFRMSCNPRELSISIGHCRRRRARGFIGNPACRSPGFLEDLAADQHAADLAGAGADFVELGVAQQPPGRVIVDVAVAAEALDGFE